MTPHVPGWAQFKKSQPTPRVSWPYLERASILHDVDSIWWPSHSSLPLRLNVRILHGDVDHRWVTFVMDSMIRIKAWHELGWYCTSVVLKLRFAFVAIFRCSRNPSWGSSRRIFKTRDTGETTLTVRLSFFVLTYYHDPPRRRIFYLVIWTNHSMDRWIQSMISVDVSRARGPVVRPRLPSWMILIDDRLLQRFWKTKKTWFSPRNEH